MKLLIDRIRLKLLLEQKREFINNSNDGLDIIITGVVYTISLLCSDFKEFFGISGDTIKAIAWLVGILILFYGIKKFIYGKVHPYNQAFLYKDIENINEVIHRFSIVAIKDTFNEYPNRFLLYYDNSWECWFFFSFHTQESDNEDTIKQRLSNSLKIDKNTISVKYITDRLQPKFSVKDGVNKVYQHSLYKVDIELFSEGLKKDTFEINGVKYKWFTIDEMISDERIREINDDVVSFVRERIA